MNLEFFIAPIQQLLSGQLISASQFVLATGVTYLMFGFWRIAYPEPSIFGAEITFLISVGCLGASWSYCIEDTPPYLIAGDVLAATAAVLLIAQLVISHPKPGFDAQRLTPDQFYLLIFGMAGVAGACASRAHAAGQEWALTFAGFAQIAMMGIILTWMWHTAVAVWRLCYPNPQ